jgi:hypothetical protein
MYFMLESVDTIANHIMALYGAKIFAFTKNESALDINLERETENGAVYIHTSRPGVSTTTGPQVERRYADSIRRCWNLLRRKKNWNRFLTNRPWDG